jgi:NAD(P)-dependent dehydrogenase (short-subunit alcohol dehydrogenase family)
VEGTRTALITGAARGIGRGIALALAENGFHIAGVDIDFDPADEVHGLLEVRKKAEAFGISFLPIQADIASLEGHKHLLDEAINRFGRIDLLVNNAGVAPEVRLDLLEMKPESYDRVLSVNARGPVFLTQRAAGRMIRQVKKHPDWPKPAIIFISSISAYVSSPSRAEYCMSKAALSHAAQMFADRLSEFGINVYEIRPGIIKTDMTRTFRKKYDKRIAEGLIPQARWGTPEDIGRAVAALADGAFEYSTGMIIEISGGMNIRSL